MAKTNATNKPNNNSQPHESTTTGDRPFLPRLPSDPLTPLLVPRDLEEFRSQEGEAQREERLREVWHRLPKPSPRHGRRGTALPDSTPASGSQSLTPESAARLKQTYTEELWGRCGGRAYGFLERSISWEAFKAYAEAKEAELWSIFHDELDLDRNGHLDSNELSLALRKAGINLDPTTLTDFMTFLSSSPHSHAITFCQFRDFLLLLPRKISAAEIYRYYEVKKFLGDDGRGAGRVTMEGDVSLSAEDKPPLSFLRPTTPLGVLADDLRPLDMEDDDDDDDDADDEEEDDYLPLDGHTALRFLSAGGIAGVVSRTATAPFDRLRIFLITRSPELGGTSLASKPSIDGLKAITGSAARIYSEGGVLAFWTGNGLSVAKIFPESAIKFFVYESSKRIFAKYWDKVDDPKDISGISRFLSGGVGGISSQLSIYPIETLKTQMMSHTGDQKHTLVGAVRHLWRLGGVKAYYRGLAIGLIGVFPYSAIDMSAFEALKLAYIRSTGKEEPGVLTVLAFGSISGSVGATSVYPLNLVRTRLQASGSSGHPERYSGMWDVVLKTYERDGWRGFYRGLFPTLAKVVPAVSITYVVYEHSKRRLGV